MSTTYSAAALIRQVRISWKSKNYFLDLIEKSRGSQRGSYFNWGTITQRSSLVNALHKSQDTEFHIMHIQK